MKALTRSTQWLWVGDKEKSKAFLLIGFFDFQAFPVFRAPPTLANPPFESASDHMTSSDQ